MMRLARHLDRFRKTQVLSRFQVIAVALVLLAVLLLLLPQGHHGVVTFVLLPALLFGTVELSACALRHERYSCDPLPQAPDLAALFQRPPPTAIA
jgi:hypothetical protein